MNAELINVPLTRLKARPQVRQHRCAEAQRRLMRSILAEGLQQAVLCAPDGADYLLIEGHGRVAVFRELGRETIPAIVTNEPATDVDVLTKSLACNLFRESLNPLDRAEALARLINEFKITAEEAARRVNLAPSNVSKLLPLLALPAALKAAIVTGKLSADSAYLLTRVDDPAEQASLAAELAEGRLTRDGLQQKLRRPRPRAGRQGNQNVGRVTVPLGAGRSVTVTGIGSSLETLIETLEQLLARARRAKAQNLSVSTFSRALRDQATA